MPDAIVTAGYRSARESTRLHAKTFFFASHVLPREKRFAAYAVYGFCRAADNALDAPNTGTASPALRLATLAGELDAVYGAGEPGSPRLAALRHAVRRFDIPRVYFDDLLGGIALDLVPAAYASFDDLLEYCYGVASTVGLIMTQIFGVDDDRARVHAEDLGTAMQLTNILRDVGEDLAMGRRYLPMEEMTAFGYTEEMLLGRERNGAFRSLMRFQIARARAYYRSADEGIPSVTDDGSRFCVRLMSRLYAGILDVIERNDYDVFTRRAALSFPGKAALALQGIAHRSAGRVPAPALPLRRRSDVRRRRVQEVTPAAPEVRT